MTNQPRWAHFIGIGGMGMRGLAEMLLMKGWRVSGSDREHSDYLARLERRGARIFIGQSPTHLSPEVDLVVHSAAIKPDNPELAAARRRGCTIRKYAQLLGELMAAGRGVAVSGTHGKTTTTAMIAFALDRAGMDPSFVVGADVPQLQSGSRAGGEILVAEACEYDRSFHNLRPEIAVITSIEEDHLDYYTGGIAEIVDSFRHFARLVPPQGLLVACAEPGRHPGVSPLLACRGCDCHLETYALDSDQPWAWTGETRACEAGCVTFAARHDGEYVATIRLGLPGRHNALNALAATAVLHHLGLSAGVIEAALSQFRGAERRSQLIGEAHGVRIVDDYAHHPTEIRCTLEALRAFHQPRRLWCVFQPHQHSRTRFLLEDFAVSFAQADCTLVPDIYFVRDNQEESARINSQVLVDRIRTNGADAQYLPTFEEITTRLVQDLRPGDVLATMGAGPVWQVAHEVLRRLNLRQAG